MKARVVACTFDISSAAGSPLPQTSAMQMATASSPIGITS